MGIANSEKEPSNAPGAALLTGLTLVGAMAGALALSLLTAGFDSVFRAPVTGGDFYGIIYLFTIAFGAVLGGATTLGFALTGAAKYDSAAGTCLFGGVTGTVVLLCFIGCRLAELINSEVSLAFLLILLWSLALTIEGFRLLLKTPHSQP